jgi:hypothetical protein
MSRRPAIVAALAVGGGLAAAYVFRRQLVELALGIAVIRLAYGWLKAQLGIQPRPRASGSRVATAAKVVEAAGVVVIANRLPRNR